MKNWLDLSLVWSVPQDLRHSGCLGMRRKMGQKLLDLSSGEMVLSSSHIQIDQAECRKIAGETFRIGFPDAIERFSCRRMSVISSLIWARISSAWSSVPKAISSSQA